MEFLPLETILQIFSFTDVATWHICRETCSTIARMLKKSTYIIKSPSPKKLSSTIRILKASAADRVRFKNIPVVTMMQADWDKIYEELSKIESITEIDVSDIEGNNLNKNVHFPLQKYSHLESARIFQYTDDSITALPPCLTRLSIGCGIAPLPKSASQLLDLEFGSSMTNCTDHCTNLTKLVLYNIGAIISLHKLTALKVLHINSTVPFPIQLSTTNLESLEINGAVSANVYEISRNINLTNLSVNTLLFHGVHQQDILTWRSLTRLRAISLRQITPDVIEPLASFMKDLPNLESLTLQSAEQCDNISAILPLNGEHLTKLQLKFPRFGPSIPNLDMSHCTALQELNLTGCIGKFPSGNLTSIEAVNLQDISFLGNLTNVRTIWTVVPLNYLLLPNLESLVVESLASSKRNVIDSIAKLTRLTQLTVQEGDRISLPWLTALTNLVKLHIPSSLHSTNKIKTQVNHVIQLTRLVELTLPHISSAKLDLISLHMTRLTYLSVFCKKSDGSALTKLTNLIELNFTTRQTTGLTGSQLGLHMPYLASKGQYPGRHQNYQKVWFK